MGAQVVINESWYHTETEVDGRQDQVRSNIEDGRAHVEAAVDHRRERGGSARQSARPTRRFVARWDARAQAADADHCRAGEQDGTHRLGGAGDQARLQGSGGVRVNRPPPEVVGGRQAIEGGYGATVGKTGLEEPEFALVPRARLSDLDPVRELPYWPAASKLH